VDRACCDSLAEMATGLLGMWWVWPLLLLLAWACTTSWRWLWVLSFELGLVGVMWAEVGTSALARFSNQRVLVGCHGSRFRSLWRARAR